MEKKCIMVQENISWARPLNDEAKVHLEACLDCRQVALEFSSLDLSVDADFFSVEIPADFTDRVMTEVFALDEQVAQNWFAKLSNHFESLLMLRPVQLSLASLAGCIALGNLIRFVFGVIIPAGV